MSDASPEVDELASDAGLVSPRIRDQFIELFQSKPRVLMKEWLQAEGDDSKCLTCKDSIPCEKQENSFKCKRCVQLHRNCSFRFNYIYFVAADKLNLDTSELEALKRTFPPNSSNKLIISGDYGGNKKRKLPSESAGEGSDEDVPLSKKPTGEKEDMAEPPENKRPRRPFRRMTEIRESEQAIRIIVNDAVRVFDCLDDVGTLLGGLEKDAAKLRRKEEKMKEKLEKQEEDNVAKDLSLQTLQSEVLGLEKKLERAQTQLEEFMESKRRGPIRLKDVEERLAKKEANISRLKVVDDVIRKLCKSAEWTEWNEEIEQLRDVVMRGILEDSVNM